MEASSTPGRLALTAAYIRAASQYWFSISRQIHDDTDRWRQRARQIPDPDLRAFAVDALQRKAANLEGAGAFVLLAPWRRRSAVIAVEVAFTALSDYLDTLSEQSSADPLANGRQLHRAQLAALTPGLPHCDYYAHCPYRNDGGYLVDLVEACREALGALPSYRDVAASALRLAEHASRFQSLNVHRRHGGHAYLERWAREATPASSSLFWWETAAAANSTLGILALLALAAKRGLGSAEAAAVETAYRPWFEALHTLLDAVVDEDEDALCGQPSLIGYYESADQAAMRIGLITSEAMRAVTTLRRSSEHLVILAAMAGFYLYPTPPTTTGAAVSESVLHALGFLAKPTVLMFRVRAAARRIDRLRDALVRHPWRIPRGYVHEPYRADAHAPTSELSRTRCGRLA